LVLVLALVIDISVCSTIHQPNINNNNSAHTNGITAAQLLNAHLLLQLFACLACCLCRGVAAGGWCPCGLAEKLEIQSWVELQTAHTQLNVEVGFPTSLLIVLPGYSKCRVCCSAIP